MNTKSLVTRALALSAAVALGVNTSQAQTLGCATGGAGGVIPTSGTGGGGVFPTTLPPFETAAPLNVASLPPGATVVTEVKLIGWTHTFIGDLQVTLTAPNGVTHNVFVRDGGGCDLSGDYTFVAECTTGSVFTGCAGSAGPGTYSQFFGTWPSGTNGIDNTPMSAIPAATGTWTLTIYDWAGADFGALTSWDLCFGTPPVPTPPAGAPSLVEPADLAVFCSSNTTLTWSTVTCATSYDVEFDGVVSSGLTSSSLALSNLTPGVHTWRVRAVNAAGTTAYSPLRSFTVGNLVPWACVTGGAGGPFPVSGIDGTWPSVLPTGELVSSLAVTVPGGATKIEAVRLNGLNHGWSGDCQIVLTSPAGVNYNIFQEVDGVFAGGCADGFSGDYAFVDPITGGDECGAPAAVFTCGATTNGIITPGVYGQFYGLWNSGDAGIVNVNLDAIPLASGTWTLRIYDWYIPADGGTLASWELCFDGGGAPTAYCTSSTTTNGCSPSISATAQPSASLATPCSIDVANVEGQKVGLIFYGVDNTGFSPLPWSPTSTSFLCIKSPTQRSTPQNSGGTVNACDGALSLDWNAFQAANPTALGNPFSAGGKVFAQGWFRDPPAPKTTNLSNGVELTVVP